MNFLVDFYHRYPIIVYAQAAFTIWMLIDASRRHVQQHWYFIILFVPVLGPWAYFFSVMAPEMGSLKWPVFQRKVPLEELRYRAQQTPTLAHHLDLGQRLIELGDYPAALASLAAAHKLEPQHGQVQYSLAFCHVHLAQPEKALPLVENLTKREPRWSNYTAWHLLIDVKKQLQEREGALAGGRELVRLSPLLQHKCILADLLLQEGQRDEVRRMLTEALQEHDYAPGPIRRRNRPWAREARQILADVGG